MPSFSTILLLAATAFTAFTSAAPTINNGGNNYNSPVIPAIVNNGQAPGHLCSTCSTIPEIFTRVQADVIVISKKLDVIVAAGVEIEAEVLTPCLNDLKAILVKAVADVKLLVGLELKVILAIPGRVLSLLDVVHLLVTLLSLVIAILKLCLKVVVAVKVEIILAIVADIGYVVAELVRALLACVTGLDVVLFPILKTLLPVLQVLKFVDLIAIITA